MSVHNLPPEIAREVSDLKQRVSDLERLLRGVDIETLTRPETIFSLPGAVDAMSSGRWYSPDGQSIRQFLASIDVTGASDTRVHVYRSGDGTPVANILIPAGQHVGGVTVGVDLTADTDWLTVAVVEAGAGAQRLVVQARH